MIHYPVKPCVEVILIYWSQTNMVIVALTNVIYKCIFVSLGHATWEIVSMYNRPKLRYNESRYSEFRDIVNKCQLPLLLKSHDIVNFAI